MLYTVQGVDWAGTGNGLLLFLAASRVFDALITVDRGIEHQQKVSNLPMPVIFMLAKRDRLTQLQPLVPAVVDGLLDALENRVCRVPG